MSATLAPCPCPLCTRPLLGDPAHCPHCHTPAGWLDLLRATAFVQQTFRRWHKKGRLDDAALRTLSTHYLHRRMEYVQLASAGRPLPGDAVHLDPSRCCSCQANVYPTDGHCAACGASTSGDLVRSLHWHQHLLHEIDSHARAGRLSPNHANACRQRARQHIAALQTRLEANRLPEVLPVEDDPGPVSRPIRSCAKQSLADYLLDPAGIQWLLGFGGGLVVLGLVIWLGAMGLFDNPLIAALLFAAGSLGLLAGGLALLCRTPHRIAGRAVTLLACLVLPLNLWFYHTHRLLTIQDHLWLLAVILCVAYAVTALLLRDPLFTYVFVGSVTLTGLLLLADVGLLDSVIAASTLLVLLGLAALHLERLFADTSTLPRREFRRSFGVPFFWSAHALVGLGVLLMLPWQVFGWLFNPIELLEARQGAVQQTGAAEVVSALLVLGAAYACFYANRVVLRELVYVALGIVALMWAEVLLLDLAFGRWMNWWHRGELFSLIGGLHLLGLGHWLWYRELGLPRRKRSELVPLCLAFGCLLAAGPLLLTTLVYRFDTDFSWPHELGLLAVGVLLLTTGVLLRVKVTTLAGAALMTLNVLTLVLYVNMLKEVQMIGVLLFLGGGAIFGLGLMLSVYRDRLRRLPDQVRRRQGVFSVLDWR